MTKHSGKASKAAFRIIIWTLVFLLAMLATGAMAIIISRWIVAFTDALIMFSGGLIGIWILFTAFTMYFFRDPKPLLSSVSNAIVAPAFGKVDVIDETAEEEFMGGKCRRISIFLSVLDVHVQRAPVEGRLIFTKYQEGKFINAMKADSAKHNENLLMGFETGKDPVKKVGIRLIAGMLARRILPWAKEGDEVARSERISLIQFGSRCDLYLPREVNILVKLGDRVKGGETIVASFE